MKERLLNPQILLFKDVGATRIGRSHVSARRSNSVANRLDGADRPFHDWYRFVLSFPPHLVREYIDRFGLKPEHRILDPFCGTGTTLVEANLSRLRAVGIEVNPVAHFASATKTDWSVNVRDLRLAASQIADRTEVAISRARKLRTLPEESMSLLLSGSICPVPLHKSLLLRETIDDYCPPRLIAHARLAFAKTLVRSASNLHFGPEVGVRGSREDADVVGAWRENMILVASDLESTDGRRSPGALVFRADSRALDNLFPPESIDAVFTSPPY
ncbi:MAG: DNA methyltransferase, partial [Candidatus Binataceae bacterium]